MFPFQVEELLWPKQNKGWCWMKNILMGETTAMYYFSTQSPTLKSYLICTLCKASYFLWDSVAVNNLTHQVNAPGSMCHKLAKSLHSLFHFVPGFWIFPHCCQNLGTWSSEQLLLEKLTRNKYLLEYFKWKDEYSASSISHLLCGFSTLRSCKHCPKHAQMYIRSSKITHMTQYSNLPRVFDFWISRSLQ